MYSFPESLACFRGDGSCDRHAPKRWGCRAKLYLCLRSNRKLIQGTTSPESLGLLEHFERTSQRFCRGLDTSVYPSLRESGRGQRHAAA